MSTLDLSDLPEVTFGPRASIWWGVLGLIAIESTIFALLALSYFYLRQNAPAWPPASTARPDVAPAWANVAVMLLSLAPTVWMHRRAWRFDRRGVVIGLVLCAVFGVASLILRAWEFSALHTRWDSNAYGSIVWSVLGMHTGHLLASTIENVLLVLVVLSPGYEAKHHVDVTVNALYWYFVVGAWIPLFVMVFLLPTWS